MSKNALKEREKNNGLVQTRENQATFSPRVDILENENELIFYADMPGIHSDHVDVRFHNGELLLHGKCSSEREDGRYFLSEYGYGDFYRAFTIEENVDPDRISAELKQGVLTVRLPKSEAVKPRRIAVRGE